jgi:hypothetical protein
MFTPLFYDKINFSYCLNALIEFIAKLNGSNPQLNKAREKMVRIE